MVVVIIQRKARNRLILIESCERLSVQIYAAYAYAIQSVLKLSNNVVLVGDHLYLTQEHLCSKMQCFFGQKLVN